MKRSSRVFGMTFGIFVVFVMLVPQWASAADQTVVSETVNITPYGNDNDETINIANSTIEYNRDTWNPLPEGVFVGGTVKESKLRINEVGAGPNNQLSISSIMEFQKDYLSSGTSEFIVRLPLYIDMTNLPQSMSLTIYRLNSVSDFHEGLTPSTADNIIIAGIINIANLDQKYTDPTGEAIYTTMLENSWISDNRVYVRIIAPIKTDVLYAFQLTTFYNAAVPFDIFICPDDLASDNITSSGIHYGWFVDPMTYYSGGEHVVCDLGWSFVFQVGLGENARSYEHYFFQDESIVFCKYVQVNYPALAAIFSFVMEMREEINQSIRFAALVYVVDPIHKTVNDTIISNSYWHNQTVSNVIVMSDNKSRYYDATRIGGKYWIEFWIVIRMECAEKITFIAYNDECYLNVTSRGSSILDRNNLAILTPSFVYPTYNQTSLWFAPFCTVLLSNKALNYSTPTVYQKEEGLFQNPGSWFSKHFLDLTLSTILLGQFGAFLYTIDDQTGGVFGPLSFSNIIHNIISGSMNILKDFIHTGMMFFKMIIDGLITIGTWLWKIGQYIWDIISWVIDVLVDTASVVLALIIYALAVIIPIGIIWFTTKMMIIFLKMSKGDLEGAASSMREVVSSARDAVGTVRRGVGK